MYINKFSSHPKNIIKRIPNIINQRLNKRLSNEEKILKNKLQLRANNEKMRLQ